MPEFTHRDEVLDLKLKISKYEEALTEIANAGEQSNPKYLSDRAQRVLSFYAHEVPVITGDRDTDALLEDERINQESEIAEYDKKLSEAAEESWRDTVLHPEYKSPFAEVDEEE
jgi:hypothetical protein